ncbi:MAG: methylated-DNA--[protein]-cysteine S-methyltransferase [Kangiellaceae bacterium]|nr:methylated-DNA--[protein]-cysteine S-methyltransferase [Kangiellaceae bacterium]
MLNLITRHNTKEKSAVKLPESRDYQRVEKAIEYIRLNFKQQPSLEQIARSTGLSGAHFQRVFTQWAGVSPKKFIQYLSIEYAKKCLVDKQSNLMDTAFETGLSGTGRLHDLFVNIEGMTPGEFKNRGANIDINYCFADTQFGRAIVASTHKGICHLSFVDDEQVGLDELKDSFPRANIHSLVDQFQQQALFIFQQDWAKLETIKLHLMGTPFQLKVWESLLSIPNGKLATYGKIASQIGNPKASRAVGTAIGSNPIAYIIPCHRVIQSSGALGGYRWGENRKSALIGWEAANNH